MSRFDRIRPLRAHRVLRPDPAAAIFSEMSRPVPAPDMTNSIMQRLGYVRVGAREARRARLRRLARRASMIVCAAIALGIGFHMHNTSADARRPVELTIPAAIGSEWNRHERVFDAVFDGLQRFAPPPTDAWHDSGDREEDGAAGPQEIDWSQQSPFKWT